MKKSLNLNLKYTTWSECERRKKITNNTILFAKSLDVRWNSIFESIFHKVLRWKSFNIYLQIDNWIYSLDSSMWNMKNIQIMIINLCGQIWTNVLFVLMIYQSPSRLTLKYRAGITPEKIAEQLISSMVSIFKLRTKKNFT